LEELKALHNSKADHILKQILAGDFKEFSSPHLPLNVKETVMERLDFADPAFSEEKQEELLRVLEEDGNYFRSLTLRNCAPRLLDDARLTRLLVACQSQSHLQYLHIPGCKGLGPEQKETAWFKPKASSFLYLETLSPLLKRLDISDTDAISLNIALPNLSSICALKCAKLATFALDSPLLSDVLVSVRKLASSFISLFASRIRRFF
jgi:hypothetical protein